MPHDDSTILYIECLGEVLQKVKGAIPQRKWFRNVSQVVPAGMSGMSGHLLTSIQQS